MEDIRAEQATPTLRVFGGKGVFAFGTDAFLLAAYAREKARGLANKRAVDLCAGTGIVGFLLMDACPTLAVSFVEINADACALCEKSVRENGFDARADVIRADVKAVRSALAAESADLVVCNPPYMTVSCGRMNAFDAKTVARHEAACTIADVFAACFYLLRTGGSAFFVYRSERIADLCEAARKSRFEIKDFCFVKTKERDDGVPLVLCRAVKGASVNAKVCVRDAAAILKGLKEG